MGRVSAESISQREYGIASVMFFENVLKQCAHHSRFSDTNMSAKDSESDNSTMRLAVAAD